MPVGRGPARGAGEQTVKLLAERHTLAMGVLSGELVLAQGGDHPGADAVGVGTLTGRQRRTDRLPARPSRPSATARGSPVPRATARAGRGRPRRAGGAGPQPHRGQPDAPEQAEAVPIAGSRREVAERLAAYAAAGVERIVVNLDGQDWTHQCDALAEAHALV